MLFQLAMPSPNSPELESSAPASHQAIAVFNKIDAIDTASKAPHHSGQSLQALARPSTERKNQSLNEHALNLETPINAIPEKLGGGPENPDTLFYLAYGSNLCAETFQGRRGIRPLSQVNVVVPELVMTFDLAGIPYTEPCFANSRYRKSQSLSQELYTDSETLPFLSSSPSKYHKKRWQKGMVGVVYEVTSEDFAHIIATEGGGSSYQDVLVDCYELSLEDPTVPEHPSTRPFKSHTLYSPVSPPGETPSSKGGRFSRPDPDYAQPSARYIKLITDGADEHSLPAEYKRYLHQLRPYQMTTQRQKVGGSVFKKIWIPIVVFVFGLNKRFADDSGKSPKWLTVLTGTIFSAMWASYDGFFKRMFGDGERTVGDDEEEISLG